MLLLAHHRVFVSLSHSILVGGDVLSEAGEAINSQRAEYGEGGINDAMHRIE